MELFKKIGEWAKGLFSKVDNWIHEIGTPVVKLLNQVKEVIYDPSLDFFVHLTKTDIDDKVLAFLREKLPFVIMQLEGWVDTDKPAEELVEIYLEKLRTSSDPVRDAIIAKTASLLAAEMIAENGEPHVKRFETDTLVQIAYDKLKAEA